MKRYPNDVTLEAKPSFLIFQGGSASLLIVGIIVSMVVLKVLTWRGVEFLHAAVFSLIPPALVTAYVWALVKDKAPSHASDLFSQACFGVRVTLYAWGLLERPPEFGGAEKPLLHPSELSARGEESA